MGRWIPIWRQALSPDGFTFFKYSNKTITFTAISPISGSKIRLRLANYYGPQEYILPSVSLKADGNIICLTNGGDNLFHIGKGKIVTTDSTDYKLIPGNSIEVRLYSMSGRMNENAIEPEIFWSRRGDWTQEREVPYSLFRKRIYETGKRPFPVLESIEVYTEDHPRVIVAFGDSITQQGTWVNLLRRRLYEDYGSGAVLLNSGIGGNRLLHAGWEGQAAMYGEAAEKRFDRDVLSIPEVKAVIIALGTNDIGLTHKGRTDYVTVEQMIDSYTRLVSRAKKAGLRVIGTTLLPRKGSPDYREPYKEKMRQEINQWIRERAPYDCVIDFDKAIQDDQDPLRIRKGCSLKDKLHPNKRGGKILADTVELKELMI